MHAEELMTEGCVTCTPEHTIEDASKLMLENDCGCIPVVEGDGSMKAIGVVTDRDIVCRAVAEGKDPSTTLVGECMSRDVVSVSPETSVEECCKSMEKRKIRRLIVSDDSGECCGIIAQADIALKAPRNVEEVVRKISEPGSAPRSTGYDSRMGRPVI